MTGDADGDNDNYESAAAEAAKSNAACIRNIPTDQEIARFRYGMALSSLGFAALALAAIAQSALGNLCHKIVCFALAIKYMMATGRAREIKMLQFESLFSRQSSVR